MPARLSKWDYRFLDLAKHIGTWSKDPSTQVGAVIADTRHRIISMGFNGFPQGVDDTQERLQDRETKLMLTQHAEVNALAFASRQVDGCTAYVWPFPPCTQCAGALIQAGITRIVAPEVDEKAHRWGDHFALAREMYQEAGVVVDWCSGKSRQDV